MMESSEKEIAWLAGLLEGEGSFQIIIPKTQWNSRPQIKVTLTSNDKDVLEKATKVAPISTKIYSADPNKRQSHIKAKEANGSTVICGINYYVYWHSYRAENLMRRVYPYMGERRKEKIKECLNTPNLSHTSKLKEAK